MAEVKQLIIIAVYITLGIYFRRQRQILKVNFNFEQKFPLRSSAYRNALNHGPILAQTNNGLGSTLCMGNSVKALIFEQFLGNHSQSCLRQKTLRRFRGLAFPKNDREPTARQLSLMLTVNWFAVS